MAAASSIILGGLTALSAANTINAQTAQTSYANRMDDINIRRAQMQEADALKRGNKEAGKYREGVRGLVGSQKAAQAASGVDINSGSALDIRDETLDRGMADADAIETNAFREALGFSMQQQDYRSNQTLRSGSLATNNAGTLLSGGIKAASYLADGWSTSKPKTSWYDQAGDVQPAYGYRGRNS